MGFVDVQNEFMDHIRDPEHNKSPVNIEERRLAIYRDLFFNNIKGFLSSAFPVIESILSVSQWHDLARGFFAQHDCRSPYFVDISKEFVEFLGNEVNEAQLCFPFLPELAHYEWLELDISVRKSGELRFWKSGVEYQEFCLSPLAELVSYQWPVHQISPTFLPKDSLSEPLFFMVFRKEDNEVTFSQINQVTAHLANLVAQTERCRLAELQLQIMHALPQLPSDQVNTATAEIVEQMLAQQIFVLT